MTQSDTEWAFKCLIISWALLIAIFDVIKRRIPNWLSISMAVFALSYLLVTGNLVLGGHWLNGLLGIGLALLLTLPGYATKKLGAGDVKFLLACALLGGVFIVGLSFITAGLLMAAVLLAWGLIPHLQLAYPLQQQKLPFGAALAIGLLCAIGAKPWLT